LGKYLWEVPAWEKAFGKVPNISLSMSKKIYLSYRFKFDAIK